MCDDLLKLIKVSQFLNHHSLFASRNYWLPNFRGWWNDSLLETACQKPQTIYETSNLETKIISCIMMTLTLVSIFIYLCVYTHSAKGARYNGLNSRGLGKNCVHMGKSHFILKKCVFCLPSCKVLNFFKVVLKMVLKSLKLVLKFC